MTLRDKQAAQVMGAAARFHRDYTGRKFRHIVDQRLPAHRSTNDHSTGRVDANYAARVFAQINTDDRYRHWLVPFFFDTSIVLDAGERAGHSISMSGDGEDEA